MKEKMIHEKDNIKTFDNEVLGEGSFAAVVEALFRKSPKTLKKIGELELAERMAENFIMCNTKEDIMDYLMHIAKVILIDEFMDFMKRDENKD